MKITRLEIESFRHLRNINFDFGNVLTVIAGSNGTGKTSLLGIIGHVFKYGAQPTTLFHERYETKYSNVFRFSATHDLSGRYKYRLQLQDGTQREAELRVVTERNKLRHRIDVGGHVRHGGKYRKPVIFLSLKRLIPLAQEDERHITFGANPLPQNLVTEYNRLYNEIFTTAETITPTHTQSDNKNSVVPTTANFDAYGISAGQDNVGSIILALLSFRQLKQQDATYAGGLLLIDELDATLYPAAQKSLLMTLLREGLALDLQIVFTTHSTDLLNFLVSPNTGPLKNNTKFVSLAKPQGTVIVREGFPELGRLLAELNHEVYQALKPTKLNFYFEDSEGRLFYQALVAGENINCVPEFKAFSIGCGQYKSFITAGFEEFDRSVIVLDGDFRNDLPPTDTNTVVYLPGEVRPENIIKDFLEGLPDNDSFWQNEFEYTKQVFRSRISGVGNDRVSMKRWFNAELPYWGQEGATIFARWKAMNGPLVQQLIARTRSVAQRIQNSFSKPPAYN